MALKRLANLKADRRGVASTVGTIMALLVVLTFLSLIVNQYVPVWTKDSEASHMSGALGQFGGFKSNLDTQVLNAMIAQQSGRAYIPVATFSPVTLGIDGVPIFSSPTIGTLQADPNNGNWTVWFRYSTGGTTQTVSQASQGNVRLSVANRYAVQQDLVYENGAIVLYQRDGQAVRVDPQMVATVSGGRLSLGASFVKIYGSGAISGQGTEGIKSKVMGADPQFYKSILSDVYINGTSTYGPAWGQFYNKTLANAFNYSASNFAPGSPTRCILVPAVPIPPAPYPNCFYISLTTLGGSIFTPQYYITWTKVGQQYTVNIQVFNRSGGGGLPIDHFEFDQSFVQVAITRVSENPEV